MSKPIQQSLGQILIYQAETGEPRLEVKFQDETVWLSQNQLAELYQTTKQNISLHINNIYRTHELAQDRTVKKYLTVQTEGTRTVRRSIDYYSLDMIIAVGYRIASPVATRFRQWATAKLKEYIVKGFAIDDARLKGTAGVVDYFDELLARIREIRASEARVYQRIREIFSLASDYRDGTPETTKFFAFMQNKMHYAATKKTAAEIIYERADASKPNMGLKSWIGGRVLKRDVGTAKNYLSDEEIDTLNRITVMFLDQAEFRAKRRQDIHMSDWETFLDKFLADTELPVLFGPGSVSHDRAKGKAEQQYDEFAERRRIEAETKAEAHYVEDLRQSAETIEAIRTKKARGTPQ